MPYTYMIYTTIAMLFLLTLGHKEKKGPRKHIVGRGARGSGVNAWENFNLLSLESVTKLAH